MYNWGTPSMVSVIKPEPVDEVLMEATTENVKADEIKVKVFFF